MIEDARNLIKHHADVLSSYRHINAQQFFNRHDVAMLVTHHRYVIEPVHVTNALVIGFRFGKLFRGAMQQTNVRVSLLNNLAVHLEHQAQYAVRRRVLRTEVHREILDLSHCPVRPSILRHSGCRRG